jgi:hypothetical protein
MESGSRSSLVTNLYGFMRVVVADPELLYISENVTRGLGENDKQRRDREVNFKIVEEIFFFIFSSVVDTYGTDVILPPSFREQWKSPTYTKLIPLPARQLSMWEYLTMDLRSQIGEWLLGGKAWVFKLALQVFGGRVLMYAVNFSVPSLPGIFKTCKGKERQAF